VCYDVVQGRGLCALVSTTRTAVDAGVGEVVGEWGDEKGRRVRSGGNDGMQRVMQSGSCLINMTQSLCHVDTQSGCFRGDRRLKPACSLPTGAP
jgi:hypothetical protein